MKKIIAIAAVSLASLTACGDSTDEKSWDELDQDQKDLVCWTTSDSNTGETRPYDEIVEATMKSGNHEEAYAHNLAKLATEHC